jgi:hypothetical protein
MLEIIAILLIVMWLLGVLSSYTWGGAIHILLALAAVVILLKLLKDGRGK